ncbi:cell wall hydrolase [Actibacterium sp. XHP0104]|uniref:cell wall hydrolase n=1 Tax=Actibacterium sp. XHP0104 TaxID=2984335 RepID=UPI0021E7C1EB|nr:cell wall hydrolase [Actibacterium sp. XHP0104]MCV2882560.1 cell wall hydrolase [Actibacterium sp. XHP0104]
MRKRFALALCVATGLSFWGAAGADVTASTSNDPTAVLDDRLTALLGAERIALDAVGIKRLEQLVTPPAHKAVSQSSGKIDFTYDWVDAQPKAKGGAEWQCLSEALYFEARGESVKGQFAVAEVILNRVQSSRFPDSVCAVVNQGTGRKHQCQFSYTCDGHKEVINEPRAYERVGKIARAMLDGVEPDLTNGATFYHTRAVSPRWSRKFERTAAIGEHLFYRNPIRVSQN